MDPIPFATRPVDSEPIAGLSSSTYASTQNRKRSLHEISSSNIVIDLTSPSKRRKSPKTDHSLKSQSTVDRMGSKTSPTIIPVKVVAPDAEVEDIPVAELAETLQKCRPTLSHAPVQCPICNLLLTDVELRDEHVNSCLDAQQADPSNLIELSKAAVIVDEPPFVSTKVHNMSGGSSSTAPIRFCLVCGKKVESYTVNRRDQHFSRCVQAGAEPLSSVSKDTVDAFMNLLRYCPFCRDQLHAKGQSSDCEGIHKHVKSCGNMCDKQVKEILDRARAVIKLDEIPTSSRPTKVSNKIAEPAIEGRLLQVWAVVDTDDEEKWEPRIVREPVRQPSSKSKGLKTRGSKGKVRLPDLGAGLKGKEVTRSSAVEPSDLNASHEASVTGLPRKIHNSSSDLKVTKRKSRKNKMLPKNFNLTLSKIKGGKRKRQELPATVLDTTNAKELVERKATAILFARLNSRMQAPSENQKCSKTGNSTSSANDYSAGAVPQASYLWRLASTERHEDDAIHIGLIKRCANEMRNSQRLQKTDAEHATCSQEEHKLAKEAEGRILAIMAVYDGQLRRREREVEEEIKAIRKRHRQWTREQIKKRDKEIDEAREVAQVRIQNLKISKKKSADDTTEEIDTMQEIIPENPEGDKDTGSGDETSEQEISVVRDGALQIEDNIGMHVDTIGGDITAEEQIHILEPEPEPPHDTTTRIPHEGFLGMETAEVTSPGKDPTALLHDGEETAEREAHNSTEYETVSQGMSVDDRCYNPELCAASNIDNNGPDGQDASECVQGGNKVMPSGVRGTLGFFGSGDDGDDTKDESTAQQDDISRANEGIPVAEKSDSGDDNMGYDEHSNIDMHCLFEYEEDQLEIQEPEPVITAAASPTAIENAAISPPRDRTSSGINLQRISVPSEADVGQTDDLLIEDEDEADLFEGILVYDQSEQEAEREINGIGNMCNGIGYLVHEEPEASGDDDVSLSIDEKLFEYIRGQKQLYSRILRYEPLDFEALHAQIIQAKGLAKCSRKALSSFLDSKAINYILPSKPAKPGETRRRRWR